MNLLLLHSNDFNKQLIIQTSINLNTAQNPIEGFNQNFDKKAEVHNYSISFFDMNHEKQDYKQQITTNINDKNTAIDTISLFTSLRKNTYNSKQDEQHDQGNINKKRSKSFSFYL